MHHRGSWIGVGLLASLFLSVLLLGPGSPLFAEEDSALHSHMKKLGRTLRKLKRQVGDPAQTDASLSRLATMQEHVLAAKVLVPESVEKLAPSARAAAVRTFRKRMIGVLGILLEMEEALLDGRHEVAAAGVAKLEALEKKGHDQFRRE